MPSERLTRASRVAKRIADSWQSQPQAGLAWEDVLAYLEELRQKGMICKEGKRLLQLIEEGSVRLEGQAMTAAACPLCGDEEHFHKFCLYCECLGEERRKAAAPPLAAMRLHRMSPPSNLFPDGQWVSCMCKTQEDFDCVPHEWFTRQSAPPASVCKNCGKPGQHYAPPSLGEEGFYTCAAPLPAESCPFCLESITDGHWHILNGWRCVFSMTAPPAVCAVCGGPPDNGTVGHHHPRPAPPAEAFRAEPVGFTREELQNLILALQVAITIRNLPEWKALAEKARRMAGRMK